MGNNPVNLVDPTGHCGQYADGSGWTDDCTGVDKQLIGLKQQAELDPNNASKYRDQALALLTDPNNQFDAVWKWPDYGWDGTTYDFWVVRDRTAEFQVLLEDHGTQAKKQYWNPFKAIWWTKLVMPHGDWDLKYDPTWRYRHMLIDGDLHSFQDVGNIHYGYVGKMAGFSDTTLKAAGGVVQVGTGHSSWSFRNTWFDDPQDQAMIQLGIDWYRMWLKGVRRW